MPRFLSPLRSFLGNFFRRRAREREERDEIESVSALLQDEGRSAREAELALGGSEQLRERVRAARFGFWLEDAGRDLRHALRQLRRNPGFTAAAVLSLALGVGANTALFSLVEGVLLRPLPYPGAGRVAAVYMDFSPQNNPHGSFSLADFMDWRARNHAFSEVGLYANRRFDLTGLARPRQERGALASSGVFAVLDMPALLGRSLQPRDDSPSSPAVAVVSEDFWREVLGANREAIGRVLTINQQSTTVVGVMPAAFQFPTDATRIWLNLRLTPPSRRGPFGFLGLGRLRPGETWAGAQAETNAIGAAIERANPRVYRHLSLPIEPLRDSIVGNVAGPLWIMMAAVLALLLITGVNLASLLLARAHARAAEMAVRASLGAGRARLVRQMLSESCLLALLGAAEGWGLAAAALAWLRAGNPANLPRLTAVHLDCGALGFTTAVAAAVGLLAGLAPALRASTRKPASRTTGLAWLAGIEVATALVLLIACGLLLRSFLTLANAPQGTSAPASKVLVARLSIRGHAPHATLDRYGNNPADIEYFDRLLPRLAAYPGVQAAAISDALPPNDWFNDDTYTIRGQPWTPAQFPSTVAATVSAGYFRALGIPLVAGREFTEDDVIASEPVVIVSQALAERHFPGRSPLGEYLKASEPGLVSLASGNISIPYCRIVGVVGNVHYQRFFGDSLDAYYLPYRQSSATVVNLILRSSLPPSTLDAQVRQSASALYPDTVLGPLETLAAREAGAIATPRFQATLIGLFALLAVALAITGVYGVLAYGVARRQREIGIRMALGARRSVVAAMVLRQGVAIAAAGVVAGAGAALLLTRFLASLLTGVPVRDPLTFAVAAAALLLAAAAASIIPALRAARADPLATLRQQ